MTQLDSRKSRAQDALAGLRRWSLERDDISDPGGRIYRDNQGNIFHSVTRILGKTAPEEQQKALQKWLERPGSEGDRAMAAQRGTLAHNSTELLLKTAAKLVRNTANRRGAWRTGSDGLERAPRAITAWALEKAVQGAPSVNWSASGYARGLRHWILENCVGIHASVEFSVRSEKGFAGSADALLDLKIDDAGTSALAVCDWKTSRRSAFADMSSIKMQYADQLGAYSYGLREMTGINVPAGAIVLARRTGAPDVTLLTADQLREAEQRFLERCERYFASLTAGS